jgi:DNA-cytosine methyltransferase
MDKELNVLSLFNGMGCIWLALDECGIKVNKRYSSEIDKYAIQVNDKNYPDTIQLGDVRNIKGSDLGFIHLLGGGSPCQSFSFAGKRNGMSTKCEIEILSLDKYLELKAQNFEFEGQSYLFWEYMRILNELREINPGIKFLLENVEMGAKWEKILTQAIGINPIYINSSLVSAQNRKRVYWTNIGAEADGLFGELYCKIPQPKDKGIFLKDVLEDEVAEKFYLKDETISALLKYNDRQIENNRGFSAKFRNPETTEKMDCLKIGGGKDDLICVAQRGRNPENPKSRVAGQPTEQMLEPRFDGKTNCLTSVQKDNYVYTANYLQYHLTKHDADNRAYYEDGKSGTLDTKSKRAKCLLNEGRIRRLTPLECERLQTVKDGYTQGISDSQRYKVLGNGWTIAVISHIFSYL